MYDLKELAALASVSTRTVHYYISQGLLPGAGSRGPGARYEQSHLDRLNLIRRLQKEHLPLAEIRKRLEAMDDAAVAGLVAQEAPEAPSSAVEYVREVLRGKETRVAERGSAYRATDSPSIRRLAPGAPEDLHGPSRAAPSTPRTPAERSQWERIALAPDVELHIRRPLSREGNRLVEQLLEFARKIFRKET